MCSSAVQVETCDLRRLAIATPNRRTQVEEQSDLMLGDLRVALIPVTTFPAKNCQILSLMQP